MKTPMRLPHLVALGPVAVAAQTWSYGGATRLTLVVKAVVMLTPDGTAAIQSPQPVLHADKHTLPGPVVISPKELLPSLQRPEVTLIGSAHAPSAVERLRARLALRRPDGPVLIDKSLEVRSYDAEGAPALFQRKALDYSNAVGGIGHGENPLGRGLGASGKEKPYLIDPVRPDRVACFAPIPAAFGERRRCLAGADAKSLVGTHVDIPDGFDWQFFQAAPRDQRVHELLGNEQILLEGMHPEHPSWTCALPGLRAVYKFYGPDYGNRAQAHALRLESLHIDADAGLCSLVWRASVPWAETAHDATVAAQLERTDEPASWPADLGAAQPENRAPGLVEDLTTTAVIHDVRIDTAEIVDTTSTVSLPAEDGKAQTLPFVGGERSAPAPDFKGDAASSGDIPGAPWASSAEPPRVHSPQLSDDTLDPDAPLDSDDASPTSEPEPSEALEAAREVEVARAEAEARRAAEARKFAEEQAEAEAEASRRAAEALRQRQAQARELSDEIYGAFRKSK